MGWIDFTSEHVNLSLCSSNTQEEAERYIWSNVHTLLVGKLEWTVIPSRQKSFWPFWCAICCQGDNVTARYRDCSATTETVALTLESPGSKHVDQRKSASK